MKNTAKPRKTVYYICVMATKKKIISKHNGVKTKFTFDTVDVDLTERQKLFCMQYLKLKLNGGEAAIAAGYSKETAVSQASRLLADANISKFIDFLKKDLSAQIGITAADIAREYAKIGFSDVRKVFDEAGNLINVKDIEADSAANISSVEVFEEYQGAGQEREYIGSTKKVKFYDKVSALDKLSKMIGADGVTKVANTDPLGNELPPKPFEVVIVPPKKVDGD